MGLVIVGVAVAVYVGWHLSQARLAHRGIPIRKGQLKGYRRDRTRHIMWIVGVGVLFLLILIIASNS